MPFAVITDRSFSRHRPVRGSRINLAHPLGPVMARAFSLYLINEGGGAPYNLINRKPINKGGVVWTPNGAKFDNATFWWELTDASTPSNAQELSIGAVVECRTGGGVAFDRTFNGSGTFQFYNNSSSYLFDAGSAGERVAVSGSFTDSKPRCFVGTYRALSFQRFFQGGALRDNRTPTLSTPTWGNNYFTYSDSANSIALFFALPFALTDKQAAWLSAEPYTFLSPPRAKRVFSIASSGITGSASDTLASATLSATGTVLISGQSTPTLAGATLSATGTVAIQGAATPTLAGASLSSTGALAITGQASNTLSGATISATGTVGTPPILGTASITLADASLSSTGALAISGTANPTLADATASSTGTLSIKGAATVTLAGATLTAQGYSGVPPVQTQGQSRMGLGII